MASRVRIAPRTQAWFRRGLTRRKGGPILGKRGGVSRNIDRCAQGSDQGPYPRLGTVRPGGPPRGSATPRGARKLDFSRGATFTPQAA